MQTNRKEAKTSSPFHAGEQAIQEKMGVREQMERFGSRVIRDHMPDQHRDFFGKLPFVFAGHADDKGWPWASILFGQPGFIESNDNTTIQINALPVGGDPLGDSLKEGTRIGLLGIELPTRRRNRLSTHIKAFTADQIQLEVDQSFGNCPQYIQTRDLEFLDPNSMPVSDVEDIKSFDKRARELIARSDTFFVASHVDNDTTDASEGADVSHRGGRPGFIRLDNTTTLTIPDYLGNNHFNTFGNFIENSRAGLLFVDFENGHLLTLTGTVEILWDTPETEFFEGAQRLWKFHIDHGRWINNALPLQWKLNEFSPNSLLSGTWEEAEKLRDADAKKNQWSSYTVADIVEESTEIRSLYLKPIDRPIAKFMPGQFLTVKIPIYGSDAIRTYTVSSAPSDPHVRISVRRERGEDDGQQGGLCSNFIHDKISVGDTIEAKAPCGNFTFDTSEMRPAVLIAAGVGITPMVSMARHALIEGVRTRHIRPITLISAARSKTQRAFFNELNAIADQSNGSIRSLWALSQIDTEMHAGKDYHHHGRISVEFLQAALPMADYDFYLCGPSGFMQSTYDTLRQLGVSDARIYAEEFGPASLRRHNAHENDDVTSPAATEAIVEFTHSQVEEAWSTSDGNLLNFAEAHGFTPEFGCRSGQCGACKTKILSGAVHYATKPSSPLEADEALLCCAVPAAGPDNEIAKLSLEL
ncbi:MAG: ferredoxin-NADP reductase [Halioglobus sp.]|jgi:ferredoxin-NADP reductase/predicted pyridoxine 5'-phosphate oxidase superfamily flavin-nucleotide-binding protein